MNTQKDAERIREVIMEAVRQAVQERDLAIDLARMTAAFSRCEEELIAVKHQLATVQQTLLVYQEAAKLRAEQRQRNDEKLDRQDLHIQELVAQVAMLQSALINKHEESNG